MRRPGACPIGVLRRAPCHSSEEKPDGKMGPISPSAALASSMYAPTRRRSPSTTAGSVVYSVLHAERLGLTFSACSARSTSTGEKSAFFSFAT